MSVRTSVNKLSHHYETVDGKLPVLSDISLSVDTGEVVAIVGPSGCGKTTILRCLAGLLDIQEGEATIDGMAPAKARKNGYVGFAFQEPTLLPWRTVEQNILLPTEMASSPCSLKVCNRLTWLLELTALTGFQRFYPSELSGGMKQRVALARALMLEPKLLLLDEPFGALDLLTRTQLSIEMSRIISEIQIPTIIVTHNIEEAAFLATEIIVLGPRPAEVLETIEVDFELPRAYNLLEDIEYLRLVAHCRSVVMAKVRDEKVAVS